MAVLERETLHGVEEVAPRDYYTYSEQFDEHVDQFFEEADLQDIFRGPADKIDNHAVLKVIAQAKRQCLEEIT